eukprot:TRINITY_DN5703_c0_g2_i22.p2 TRINITY_DN5703_c0_g2~~TRINITY_DN5703_c0_g2_i22.p2  ORF type:complete len:107 (+),score=23.19 TRINITY_DN5703_c0_g2_i22:498-818(+)
MQVGCYALVFLANPGTVVPVVVSEERHRELSESFHYCKRCRVIREKGVYHCKECDVCIDGYDHHCPWVGKCIGKGNLRYFQGFMASTLVLLLFITFATPICSYLLH